MVSSRGWAAAGKNSINVSLGRSRNKKLTTGLCIDDSATTGEEMLGNQGVTESNMMQYLGIIEERTIEILQLYGASQSANEQSSGIGIKPCYPPSPPLRLQVQLPTLDDEQDDPIPDGSRGVRGEQRVTHYEEDEDRPYTRSELHKNNLRLLLAKKNVDGTSTIFDKFRGANSQLGRHSPNAGMIMSNKGNH